MGDSGVDTNSPWEPSWSQPSPEGRGRTPPSCRTWEAIIENKTSVNVLTLTVVLVSLKSGRGGVSARLEPAQAILHLRFCNQQAGISCISRIPEDIREHVASAHREMPCELCYRDQVLTILSFGECSGPELDVWRIILKMEILAELHKKKRLWIFGRSDQQGTAGNPRENKKVGL